MPRALLTHIKLKTFTTDIYQQQVNHYSCFLLRQKHDDNIFNRSNQFAILSDNLVIRIHGKFKG